MKTPRIRSLRTCRFARSSLAPLLVGFLVAIGSSNVAARETWYLLVHGGSCAQVELTPQQLADTLRKRGYTVTLTPFAQDPQMAPACAARPSAAAAPGATRRDHENFCRGWRVDGSRKGQHDNLTFLAAPVCPGGEIIRDPELLRDLIGR